MKEWEAHARSVVPYTPGEQPSGDGIIKLNTNENPYPPAPEAMRALKEIPEDTLRLYPDPTSHALVSAIADFYGRREDEVFVGVGSDEVLALSFLAFFDSEKPILFPDITYSFYDVWANLYRIPYVTLPLDESFAIRKEDYLRDNGGIVLANPNAPTGSAMDMADIEDIIRSNPSSVVIVDEAYVDFGAASALPLVNRYDNLLVVQTFSKSRSLAGLRVGFAIGQPRLIKILSDVKYSFNSYTMNRPAILAGAAALGNRAYFQETCRKVMKTREWTKQELSRLGFTFPDSKANFIFATHPEARARELFDYLKTKNIYVRYFNKPRINNYLRITIGTQEQMETLVHVLEEYLSLCKK